MRQKNGNEERIVDNYEQNWVLSFSSNFVPYFKELRIITGSVTASILMARMDALFSHTAKKSGRRWFYKFLEETPGHRAYKENDSWIEELGFSVDEFRSAFDKIGIRYTSKTAFMKKINQGENPFATEKGEIKYYASYHDKSTGLTFYFRNSAYLNPLLKVLTMESRKWTKDEIRKLQNRYESRLDRNWLPEPEKKSAIIGPQSTIAGECPSTVDRDGQVTVTGECPATVTGESRLLEMENVHLRNWEKSISRDGESPSTLNTYKTTVLTSVLTSVIDLDEDHDPGAHSQQKTPDKTDAYRRLFELKESLVPPKDLVELRWLYTSMTGKEITVEAAERLWFAHQNKAMIAAAIKKSLEEESTQPSKYARAILEDWMKNGVLEDGEIPDYDRKFKLYNQKPRPILRRRPKSSQFGENIIVHCHQNVKTP